MLAGAAADAHLEEEKIKELFGKLAVKKKEISKKDLKIAELEKSLVSSVNKVIELEGEVKKATNRVTVAELVSGVHSKKVG